MWAELISFFTIQIWVTPYRVQAQELIIQKKEEEKSRRNKTNTQNFEATKSAWSTIFT